MKTELSVFPRRSFLALLLASPLAPAAAHQRWFRPGQFSVALCGWHGGLNELLAEMLGDLVGKDARIWITEETFVEPLLDQAGPIGLPGFDLLIVFFNPELAAGEAPLSASTGERARVRCRSGLHLLERLRARCGRPPLVIHNGWAGYTTEQFRQAGAGEVLPMPFTPAEFSHAVNGCMDIPTRRLEA